MSTQYTPCKVSHVATGTHKLGRSDKVDTVPTGRDCVCLFYYALKHPVKLCCGIYVFLAIIIFHALCWTVHSTWALRMKVKEVGAKASVGSSLTLKALEPQFYSPNAGHQSSDSLSRSFFSAAPLPYHSRKMDGVIPSTRLRFWLLDPPRSSVIIVVINGAQSGDQLREGGAIGLSLKQPCVSDFKKEKKLFFFLLCPP